MGGGQMEGGQTEGGQAEGTAADLAVPIGQGAAETPVGKEARDESESESESGRRKRVRWSEEKPTEFVLKGLGQAVDPI